jgi:hypothetical protein
MFDSDTHTRLVILLSTLQVTAPYSKLRQTYSLNGLTTIQVCVTQWVALHVPFLPNIQTRTSAVQGHLHPIMGSKREHPVGLRPAYEPSTLGSFSQKSDTDAREEAYMSVAPLFSNMDVFRNSIWSADHLIMTDLAPSLRNSRLTEEPSSHRATETQTPTSTPAWIHPPPLPHLPLQKKKTTQWQVRADNILHCLHDMERTRVRDLAIAPNLALVATNDVQPHKPAKEAPTQIQIWTAVVAGLPLVLLEGGTVEVGKGELIDDVGGREMGGKRERMERGCCCGVM